MSAATRGNCRCGIPYTFKPGPAGAMPRCPFCGLPPRAARLTDDLGIDIDAPLIPRWAAIAGTVALVLIVATLGGFAVWSVTASVEGVPTSKAPVAVRSASATNYAPVSTQQSIGPIEVPLGPIGASAGPGLR